MPKGEIYQRSAHVQILVTDGLLTPNQQRNGSKHRPENELQYVSLKIVIDLRLSLPRCRHQRLRP